MATTDRPLDTNTGAGSANMGIQLANLLVNASGTTTNSSTAPSAASLANSNSVFGTAMTNATDQSEYDALVQNILQQSAIAFAPTLTAGTGGSGLYNSSTLALMQGNAQAQATAQSVQAVTTAKQAALNTAATTSDAQMQASKSATSVQTPNLVQTMQSLLPSLAISSVLGKPMSALAGKLSDKMQSMLPESLGGAPADVAGNGVTATAGAQSVVDPVTGSVSTQVAPAASETYTVGPAMSTAADTTATTATAVGDTVGSSIGAGTTASGLGTDAAAATAAGAGIDATTGLAVGDTAGTMTAVGTDGALSSVGTGVSGAGYTDAAGNWVVGSASTDATGTAVGTTIADGALADGAVGTAVGTGVGTGAAIGTAAEVGAAASESAGLGDIALEAAAAWVICTELHSQGLLDGTLYKAGAARSLTLDADTLAGYHAWAVPFTRLMRKSSLAVKFIRPLAVARNRHILGDKNFIGWLSVAVGEPICWLVGKLVTPQSWKSLYTQEVKHG